MGVLMMRDFRRMTRDIMNCFSSSLIFTLDSLVCFRFICSLYNFYPVRYAEPTTRFFACVSTTRMFHVFCFVLFYAQYFFSCALSMTRVSCYLRVAYHHRLSQSTLTRVV